VLIQLDVGATEGQASLVAVRLAMSNQDQTHWLSPTRP
jgi:hypothetical protein